MGKTVVASLIAGLLLTITLTGCQPAGDDSRQQPRSGSEQAHAADVEVSERGGIYISPNDERDYGVVRLDNGLNIIVVSDRNADKAAAALNVHVGSMQNPDEQLGLAHYLEHMLFLGTEKYPDPDEYGDFMARHGGMHNAYTADDHTNYMFQINNDRLDEALDRFSDFFKAPVFDPDYSEKEVNAVDSEWSMRRASDGFILFKLNNVTLNPAHPMARFRIGNNETLSDKEGSILYDEMLDFYRRYYSANLMTAAIVGNYSVEELKEKAQSYFADIPNHNAEVPEITVPAVTSAERSLQIFYQPQMELRILQIDFTIENNQDQFAYKPNELVAYLINSEMPGTPGAFLREQGWADTLNAYAQPNSYGNAGRFIIQVELTESGQQNREVIAGMLFDYLQTLRDEGIGKSYYDELGTVLNNRFQFLQRTDAFNYATQLAASMQHYPLEHVIDASYRLDEYNPDAIRAVLAQLTPDNARVWFMSPDEEVDQKLYFFDGEYRVEPLTADVVDAWREQSADISVNLPSVNTLLPEDLSVKAIEDTEAHQVIGDDGVNAWLKRSERFVEPRANVAIHLYQNSAEQSLQQRMAAEVIVEAFNLAEQALAREASIAGVNFSLSVSEGLHLSLSGFNDKQPLLAERVLSGFASYEPSEERVAQVKDRLRRGIENQGRQFPVQQLGPRFGSLMNKPGANTEAQIAALSEVQLDDVLAARDTLLSDVHLRVLVLGNYDADGVGELVASIRDVAGVTDEVSYQRSDVVTPRDGSVIIYNRDVQPDDVALLDAYLLADDSVTSRAKASLLAELMHSRFFNDLRTEQQLGYAVGVTNLGVQDYPGVAFYIQSSVAEPQDLISHFDRFRTNYSETLSEMDDESFGEARQGLLVSLREQPQNLNQEAARLRSDWTRENYQFNGRAQMIAAVENLSKADIEAFYNEQILDAERHTRVLIQLRGSKFADAELISVEGAVVADDIAEFQQGWDD